MQIWIVQVQGCSRCIAAKLFTWLVSNLFFKLSAVSIVDMKLLYIWSEGCPPLPSFLGFARKSRHSGLIKPCIQVRHAQGMHNVEGDKNYKAYLSPQYFDAQLTQLGWQQVRQTAKCLTQKKRKNNSRNAANAVQEKHGGNLILVLFCFCCRLAICISMFEHVAFPRGLSWLLHLLC